jgi:hypothetical protein
VEDFALLAEDWGRSVYLPVVWRGSPAPPQADFEGPSRER